MKISLLKNFALLIFVTLFASIAFSAPLTEIKDVTYLNPEIAAEGLPVVLEAQVIHFHPKRDGVFLFDGELGIFCRLPLLTENYEDLKVGSIVRVSGKTSAGGFVPDVTAESIEVLGWKELPKARELYSFEIPLTAIHLDCAWVSIYGRLVDAHINDAYNHIMLEVIVSGVNVDVHIPYSEAEWKKVEEMMFQRVTFSAVIGTVFNRNRQMTGRVFYANSLDDFVPNKEGEAWLDSDVRPIHTLMRAGENFQKKMHTHGLVTYADEKMIYLRGEKSCMRAATMDAVDVQPGDYVDLLGYIWPKPISPAFRATEIKILEKRKTPEPRYIDLKNGIKLNWHNDLVSIDALVVEIDERFNGEITLLCRAEERVFEAKLPVDFKCPSFLKIGARVRLTGICDLIENRDPRWEFFVSNLRILVRKNDGITLLERTSWWTPIRLVIGLGIVAGTAVLFLIWVFALRKTVSAQTKQIGLQIERESIFQERQRIAQELHDTLEQSLAGVALQLKNCDKNLDKDLEKGRSSLELARGMLKHCRSESRSSIMDLRDGLLEKMMLHEAIQESVFPLTEECGAKFRFVLHGEPLRLNQTFERHILRIAKEAATNAARHANPSEIFIELTYRENEIILKVEDDGSGFSVENLPKSERFGVRGLQERVSRLNGKFSISSEIGQGTKICVSVPINIG